MQDLFESDLQYDIVCAWEHVQHLLTVNCAPPTPAPPPPPRCTLSHLQFDYGHMDFTMAAKEELGYSIIRLLTMRL